MVFGFRRASDKVTNKLQCQNDVTNTGSIYRSIIGGQHNKTNTKSTVAILLYFFSIDVLCDHQKHFLAREHTHTHTYTPTHSLLSTKVLLLVVFEALKNPT